MMVRTRLGQFAPKGLSVGLTLVAMLIACAHLAMHESGWFGSSALAQGTPPGPQTAPGKPGEKESIEARSWQILTAGVGSDNASKRSEALAALATIGARRDVVRLVEGRLADKEAEVRQLAAALLGTMKARAAIPKLRAALEDENADVSFAVAQALWEMGDGSGRTIIYQVLEAERRPTKGAVGGQIKSAKKMLRNPASLGMFTLKQGAEAFLGPFGLGVDLAEGLTKDRSAPARALAATLLAKDSDAGSVHELEAVLTDKNSGVRIAAARALGNRGSRQSVAQLVPLLQDGKEAVRFNAAAAIIRLSGSSTRAQPAATPPR